MKRALFLNLHRNLQELDLGKSNAMMDQQFSDSEIDRLFAPFEKAFILTVARKHLSTRYTVFNRSGMPSSARIEGGLDHTDIVFLFDLYHRILHFEEQEKHDQEEKAGTSAQTKSVNKKNQNKPAGDDQHDHSSSTGSKRLRSDQKLGEKTTTAGSSVVEI